jgi:putative transposase
MRLWLSAQEIADAALRDMPQSKRGVLKLAERDGWKGRAGMARRRPGAQGGGGFEYHINLLPCWAHLDYLRRHLGDGVPSDLQRQAAAEPEAEGLSASAAAARDARLYLVDMADRFHRDSDLTVVMSDQAFVVLFNSHTLPVLPWAREAVGHVSERSIARWRSAVRRGAISSLAVDRGLSRKGTGILDRANDGAVRTLSLALLAKNPQLTAKHIRATVRDRLGDELQVGGRAVALPPIRTFQHALKHWRHEFRNELTRLTDPDGYKNKVRLVATGSTKASRLNEVWQIDASPADVMTKDGRQSIYVGIDVFSRRMKIQVAATAKADAVGLLTRKCLIAWGVPERIKSDNGSDFKARQTVRLLAALGIEHELSAPFSPEQKGIVERAIGTFQHDCARTLPGFIGHSVADRKKIEAKTAFAQRLGADDEALFGVDLTAAELQSYADDWAEKVYANTPHAGLKGATPFEKAASYAGPVRRIEDLAALDVLLARVPGKDGIRRVTRSGIRIDGTYYLIASVPPGEDVLCRMDPADLGRVYVFAPDGETFLGHAVAPELAGLDPAETIARVRAEQTAYLNDRLAPIRREAKRIGPRDVADAIRRGAERDAAALIAFPRPAEPHETAAMAAAGAAMTTPEAQPLNAAATAMHAQLKREAPNVTPLRNQETKQQRFRRALAVRTAIEHGNPVEPDEAVWLGGYEAGPEFRAMRDMYEDFGEQVLR